MTSVYRYKNVGLWLHGDKWVKQKAINLLYLFGVQFPMRTGDFCCMFVRDVEMFIEHCENKGLAKKTIGSYEQTLRLLMLYLDEQEITQTEKITHTVIQNYVKRIKERGKYTVTSNPNSGNYQERRLDFGKKVSDVTINNYLWNMSAFFSWCVEEDLILRSPVKRGDYIKVERRPLSKII